MKDTLKIEQSARMLTIIIACGLLATTGPLSFGNSGKSEPDVKSEHAAEHKEHAEKHEEHPSEHEEHMMKDENNLHQLWTKINSAKKHLRALVKTGELKQVHEAQEALSGLIDQLPAKSEDLADNKQKRIKGTLKSMNKLLEELHEAADAGRADESRKKMKALDGLFTVLKAQYPANVTTGKESDARAGNASSGHAG